MNGEPERVADDASERSNVSSGAKQKSKGMSTARGAGFFSETPGEQRLRAQMVKGAG